MHELGIAESAVASALSQMRVHGAHRVLGVTLRVGALAAVDPDALRFAFESVVHGTSAEGAELRIESVETTVQCAACNELFTTEQLNFFSCPKCGEYSADVRSGREIELVRLELDK